MNGSAHLWCNAWRLKTRQLSLLLHLHEQGSVLHAAEAASMTQPAASKLLAEMEDVLGVRLFERHARGVVPTAYGQALIRRARAAMCEIGRAQDEIAALRGGRSGQAAIGTVVNPGTNLVPLAIAQVKREFPQILVRVDMDYSRPLVSRLLDGQLDIVVGRILGSAGADELAFEPLADEQHSVIAGAGHPLAGRTRLRHAELVDHGWVLPPADSVLRTRLDLMFIEHGLPVPSNIIETASLPVTTNLLCGSDLLAALPVDSVAPLIQAGLLIVLPINLGVRMESFGIIRRRGQVLSPGAERIVLALRDVAGRLYE